MLTSGLWSALLAKQIWIHAREMRVHFESGL